MKKEPEEPKGLEELRERTKRCRRGRPRDAAQLLQVTVANVVEATDDAGARLTNQ